MARINNPTLYIYVILLLLLQYVCQISSSSHSNSRRSKKIVRIQPYIIDYGNGTIVRDPIAAPSYSPPPNNSQIQSKDITIFTSPYQLRARVISPAQPDPSRKVPVLVYFHGGAFCIGSAFGWGDTNYLARVVAQAGVIAVAIDYRLYPEHHIPAAYDDGWAGLKWVAAHKSGFKRGLDQWLAQYGDLNRVFVGGDSSGGNIAHNVVLRAGLSALPNSVTVSGMFLAMPYFLGSSRVPLEPATIIYSPNYRVWPYVCHKCKGGVDNAYINPFARGSTSLTRLGCRKVLVYTAEIDELRGRGRWYYERVKSSGWKGQAQWIEAQGEEHIFHISKPDDPATAKLISDFSAFFNA